MDTLSSQPLLVLTGFSAKRQNIALDSLKALYQSGQVYVLADAKPMADSLLGASALAPTLATADAFAPRAKDKILLTLLAQSDLRFKALAVNGQSFFKNYTQYPLYTGGGAQDFPYSKWLTKFTLTGVTAITRNMGFAADAEGLGFLTKNLLPEVKDSDLLHISNEVSFAEGCYYKKYDPSFKFCTKKEHFQALVDLGADIVELTGNHNLDYGPEAYRQTFAWYEAQGMRTFGGGLSPAQANQPAILTLKDGKKIGFIGFNELCPVGECADQTLGANRYTREKAQKALRALRPQVDWLIATVQFGEVDAYTPSATQSQISRDLIDFGADRSMAHRPTKCSR
ncbi:MAG: hypothetical protein OHK0053_37580 [Microscillaceae bacterium]